MKDKLIINRESLDIFIIYLIILMDCNYLFLFPIPAPLTVYWSPYVKFALVFISLVYTIIIRGWRINNKFIKRYLILLTISFMCVSLLSNHYYPDEKIHNHILQYGGVFLVVFAFPLIAYFKRCGSYEPFLKGINVIAFLIYMLFIGQLVLSKIGGPFVLSLYHSTRYGNLRMGLSIIGNVMVIYNFCRLLYDDESNKAFNAIQLVLGLFCVFVIQQTRAYEIAFCIVLGILTVFKGNKTFKQQIFLILAFLAAIIVIATGVLDTFLASFTSGSEVASTEIRQVAYLYFFYTFLENPLWGHGFLTDSSYQSIKVGPWGYFYYADTGIVGLLAQWGLFVIPVYIYPFIYWTKLLIKKRHEKIDPFLVGLIIFLIALSPTLLCLNPERVLIWPICFALFVFLEGTEKQEDDRQSLLWFGNM